MKIIQYSPVSQSRKQLHEQGKETIALLKEKYKDNPEILSFTTAVDKLLQLHYEIALSNDIAYQETTVGLLNLIEKLETIGVN